MSELQKLQEVTASLREKLDAANLQVGETAARAERLSRMLNDVRKMILGARTVHEISELARDIMRRIEGPDEDVEKPKCEPNATICHETVRFDGGPIYCYQPMPCRVHGVEKRKCECGVEITPEGHPCGYWNERR